jgi:ABC-type bacteriocin/lantibiotic exporter with double-glycine peptidase domain
MVLGGFGLQMDEDQLRSLTDCTPLGTDAFQLVEAARQLGFTASRKYTLSSIDDLARLLDEGLYPIVYVDLWPIRGGQSGQIHSLVVVRIEQGKVMVLDPIVGETNHMLDEFQAAWAEMRFLTIVISA